MGMFINPRKDGKADVWVGKAINGASFDGSKLKDKNNKPAYTHIVAKKEGKDLVIGKGSMVRAAGQDRARTIKKGTR